MKNKVQKTKNLNIHNMKKITAIAALGLCAQFALAQQNVTTTAANVTTGALPYFTTAGSPILGNSVITQSGSSIGIGTTTPGRTMEVRTGAQNGGLRVTQTTSGYSALELYNLTSGGHNYALVSTGSANGEGSGGFGVYDYTTGSDKFFINAAGSVGIGTNTPFSKFDINGINSTSGVIANFANGTYKTFFTAFTPAGAYNGLVQTNDNAIIWDNGTNGNGVTNGLVLSAWNGAGGVRINANGATSVNCSNGITSSPFVVQKSGVNLFQVDPSGNVGANGNIVLNNNPGGSPVTNAQLYLKTWGGVSADANHGLGYFASYNNGAGTSVGIDGPVLYGYSGGALGYTAGGPKFALRWDNAGKVYIGSKKQDASQTGNHSSALLQVNGDVVVGSSTSANIYVTQNYWADFVFDKNYALMPLNEVENFYNENHHLPNVPTTKEIQENGNNLGQTDAVLLQKIEELTLYMVKQQKEIETLKKQVEQTKK